jgi:hypothetical protein
MTDRRRYSEMSDDELESLIRGLPGRGPSSGLRTCVLSHRLRPRPTRRRAPRPALAFAAFICLLLADLLVLNLQDAGLAAIGRASPAVVTAQARPQEDERLAWLKELGVSGLGLRVAQLSADSGTRPQTRAEVLRSLLAPGNGG